ncbi:ArsC/Spx/MgsR family protein [Hyphomonas sp.]|uniref:ArsC/Spx/MgsR family protein n=1 Tax=Hyphomonas sp. TaxID=87 RepID=UPI0025C4650B|nr:ArsC/Spx/MgsR family protein [Hyphomonas sp.]
MTIKLFGLKNCDTCKKALGEIKATGHKAEFVDIRAEADLARKVPEWLKAVGDKLVNRSSTTWRALTEENKARATGSSLEGLLLGNPTLIKRPVIEVDGDVLIGWTDASKARIG